MLFTKAFKGDDKIDVSEFRLCLFEHLPEAERGSGAKPASKYCIEGAIDPAAPDGDSSPGTTDRV